MLACMCGCANQHATSREVCVHVGRQVTSLGMPGSAAYLQQYGGAMPAGVMGALAGQPGDWQRGSGVPTGMAWPYRGGGTGGGNDIGGQAANTGNAQQNQLSYQMLVNASLYQQSQGFAAGNSGGLVDMGLLPNASGYAGTGGMQVCKLNASLSRVHVGFTTQDETPCGSALARTCFPLATLRT